ncbi:hypothetical protein Taro_019833 [Colocasia esculenta]|uniref:SANTA domain-containing protein n=1 Tax=Colocasia esculenta TaxID=4460 RepID=A0A843UUV1_COLES|nr:hypothetical protein [Colocasia esculenta]
MGNSSSSVPPRASEADERSHREAGGVAASPPSSSTTSCASSFEKTVLLHDWWLIKAEDECSRARLAVGGLATTGFQFFEPVSSPLCSRLDKKAVRIFKSALIVKRYDGYTIETADGITVRIQGLINASRTHQNGFPSEACNHFRIGFPYGWKDYADRYFQTDTKGNGAPTCASDIHDCSMDSANTSSYCFPACSKEFPVGRIVDCFNSICKEIVDGAERSTDTAQNLCKNNDCKENTNGIVAQTNGSTVVSDGNSNVAEENAYMATNNDTLGGLKQVSSHVSNDSLLCGNMNNDSLLEEVTGFQRESLATVVAGPDNEKQQLGHASIDVDGLMKDIDGNTCCINAPSAVDSGAKVLLSKSLPENWEESVSIEPNENHPSNEAEQVVHLSVTTLSHESDVEHMNSPRVQLNPVSSDTACNAKRACNSFNNNYVRYRHLSVSQNFAGINHNQGESRGFSHLDGAKVGFTNAMHLEVSDVTGNSSHMASDHTLSRHSDENTVGSVASMMAPSNRTPAKQVAIIDRGRYEKISPSSCMKDLKGKFGGYLNSATKVPSSMFVKDVNHCPDNWEMRLIDSNTMDLGSEEVLAECFYNEANDLQPESSKKLPSHTSDSAYGPSNIDNNPEENSTDLPDVGMTVSESRNKQFFLRRSERLSKLKIPAEDAERSLEHNKGNLHETKCGRPSNEDRMHIDLEGNNISSKKHDLGASQEELMKSQDRCVSHSQEKKKNGRNKNQSVADTGKNRVLSFSDGYSFMNSENIVRDTHDLMRNRIEADAQNLDMPTGEQSNSRVGISCVAERAKQVRQLIEADAQNLDIPTGEQSNSGVGISCVAEYAKEVCQPDVHVNAQPNDGKSPARPARRSRKKSHFASHVGKTPLTRQRTKELSLASPALLNFKRSRSGRLLVPTLANWCQQILYDVVLFLWMFKFSQDGSVAGILTGVDAIKCDRRVGGQGDAGARALGRGRRRGGGVRARATPTRSAATPRLASDGDGRTRRLAGERDGAALVGGRGGGGAGGRAPGRPAMARGRAAERLRAIGFGFGEGELGFLV